MIDKRIDRILEMEERFNRVSEAVTMLKRVIKKYNKASADIYENESFGRLDATRILLKKAQSGFEAVGADISALEEYYDTYWQSDYEADENGELPADMKRGVLSQDGLYNLFEKIAEVQEMEIDENSF